MRRRAAIALAVLVAWLAGSTLGSNVGLPAAAARNTTVLIVPTDTDVERATSDARFFLAALEGLSDADVERVVLPFPSHEVDPYRGLAPHFEIASARARTLHALATGSARLVVASGAALLPRVSAMGRIAATAATLHCLTGCVIGELIGLVIGVSLGLSAWQTIVLATSLSYLSGFTLGLLPLVRHGMTLGKALRTIWLGEAISIGVMEIAMNFADYHVGGMSASSVLDPMFWLGVAVAVPAGFIAAWPVNWWLLRNNVKQPCH